MKLYLLLPLLLGGCVFNTTNVRDLPIPEGKKVHFDERLLVECKPLSDIIDNPKPSDVIAQHAQDVVVHEECMKGKKLLIEAVRKAFP